MDIPASALIPGNASLRTAASTAALAIAGIPLAKKKRKDTLPKLAGIVGCFLLSFPAICFAQEHADESTARQYTERLVNPDAVVRSGAAAGLDQALTNPYEWGGGIAGYGRRLGSAFGTHLVRSSIHFGVSKLLHEELNYSRSNEKGFGPRLKYALLNTVITRKTTTQRKTFAVGETSGIVGGGFISRLWHPASYHTVASGFAATGVGFGVEAGMNVLHEFWPEIRHPHDVETNPQPVKRSVEQQNGGAANYDESEREPVGSNR